MKYLLAILSITMLLSGSMAQAQIGIFDSSTDVGDPKVSGSTEYDSKSELYTLQGGGYNIWFGRDEFQYPHTKLTGDFILTANFAFLGEGVDPHRKIGWMIRESLDDDAPHISATLHGDGLTVLQWRPLKGAHMRDPQDQIICTKESLSNFAIGKKREAK